MPFNVKVQNFQSIKQANIVIDGFTVVTGPNNSGKSALMRAIRGVFLNLGGTSFVRHGQAKAEVTLSFDGHTICWEKGKGGAQYVIDNTDPLTNVGRGAPEPVLALGVSPIRVGSDRKVIWPQIAEQFTGQVFLLNETGSVIAEAIADVDRVRALNLSLRDVESDRRAAKSKIKVREGDLLQFQNELIRFEGIDDVVARIAGLVVRSVQVQQASDKIDGLHRTRQRLQDADLRIQSLEGVQNIALPSEQRLREAQQLRVEAQQLRGLRDRQLKVNSEIRRFSKMDLVLGDEGEKKLRKVVITQKLLGDFRDRLVKAEQGIVAREMSLVRNQTELGQVQEHINVLLGDMEECPTCGRAFSPESGDHGHL